MKINFKYFFTTSLIGLILVSCSNDDGSANVNDTKIDIKDPDKVKKDTEAPSFLSKTFNLTVIDETSLSLAWFSARDNVDVVSYEIKQGDDVIATLGKDKLRYEVKNLQIYKDYVFTLTAKDKEGNTSEELKTEVRLTPPIKISFKLNDEEFNYNPSLIYCDYTSLINSINKEKGIVIHLVRKSPHDTFSINIPSEDLVKGNRYSFDDTDKNYVYSPTLLKEGTRLSFKEPQLGSFIKITYYNKSERRIEGEINVKLKNQDKKIDKVFTFKGTFALNFKIK